MRYLEPWRYLPVPSQNIHSGRSLSREDLFVELEQDHKIVHLMAPPNKETKKNTKHLKSKLHTQNHICTGSPEDAENN